MTELTNKQTVVLDVLRTHGLPCSLSTILSKSAGAFGSKAQLKNTMKDLVKLGAVKLQSNSYYRLPTMKASKAKQPMTFVEPAKAKKVSKTKPPKVESFIKGDKPAEFTGKVPTGVKATDNVTVKVTKIESDLNGVAADDLLYTETVKVCDKSASVLNSLEKLEQKVNAPGIHINDRVLKSSVLSRLSQIVSEDISDVLLAINNDLNNVSNAGSFSL